MGVVIKLLAERNVKIIWSKNGEEIWFNATDVGEELGVTNIRQLLPKLDRQNKKKFTNSGVYKVYSRNFEQPLNNFGETFIDEEAVYNITFRSNKPEAKIFTKWVTKVLKQIRINGYYIATEKDEAWLGARSDGKIARHIFTDEIQAFVEYAKSQGSSKPE